MAHMLFDALNGVSLDNHTVQSILDSTTLSSAGPPTTITLDEEDVFQCGKCKRQFTSFSLFMCHKKEHTTAGDISQESETVDPSSFQQLEVQALNSPICTSELCQRIIFSEADILSFSIEDEDALNISSSDRASSSIPNVQDGSSFFTTNAELHNNSKQELSGTSSSSVSSSFNVSTLSGQPVVLTPQSPQSSYQSTLPSIQSLPSHSKLCSPAAISNVKDATQNISILAASSEGQPKTCKILLPNIDYIEETNGDGTLLLEHDKTSEKLLHYGGGSMGDEGTVLLDYCDGDSRKTCKVLLTNGEYTETNIEYIDSTNEICKYSSISGVGDTGPDIGTVSVSFLDVIHQPGGSSATLDLSKAFNSEHVSVPEHKFSAAIPEESSSAETEAIALESVCHNLNNKNITNSIPTDGKENGKLPSVKLPKLKCHYCEKMFAKNFDLQQHLRSHTGEKPFQCVVCGRAFSQKSNVKKHMATHKVWPDGFSRTLPKEPLQVLDKFSDNNGKKKIDACDVGRDNVVVDRSYVCQYCNTSFTSYYELKTHMKKHSHEKVYKCVQHNCHKTFEDLDSFLKHTRVHTDEFQYCCHVCLKKFNSLADLGIHQYTHDPLNRNDMKNTRYFLCMKCKSKFTSLKALDHHLSTTNHHFPCTRCGKVFTCERYLRRHLPTHGAPETYVCPTCGKGFRTEQYLNTHRLIHSGVKPYICMHCPAAFNRKDKLARHSLIHQAVKKFKCPFHNHLGCSKEFNRRDKLKLHILTHSSVKPFNCHKCNKIFHKQTQLREHERSHHTTDAPFSCTHCGLNFKKKVHLTTHLCASNVPEEQDITSESLKDDTPPEAVTSKSTRCRRFRKTRSKKITSSDDYDVGQKESQNFKIPDVVSGSTRKHDIDSNSVPTIEIILMPISVKEKKEKEDKNGIYRVVIPASSNRSEVQTKSVQSHLRDTLNNSSCSVPDGHNGQTIMSCINSVEIE